MRLRAEQVAQTRQRIVDAAVALHGSVGPAATTIAAIADLAQVTRLTVYRHFPDEEALFNACSAHWLSQQRLPAPDAWARIGDPAGRLRAGLADLYRFYRQGADMLVLIYRDFEALPEPHQEGLRERDGLFREVLAAPFGDERLTIAAIGHAVSFWTWHSLCAVQGLSDQEAVDIMTTAVLAITGTSTAVAHDASVAGMATRRGKRGGGAEAPPPFNSAVRPGRDSTRGHS